MSDDAFLTVEEAIQLLHPPVSADELRHLIAGTGTEAQGGRYTGRRGRPALCYSMRQLMLIHAANIPLMPRYGGVNAGVHGAAKVLS
jgi:hypothetical protein